MIITKMKLSRREVLRAAGATVEAVSTVDAAVALLDEHERRLQEKIIYGEPPLGPGAAPHERLAAFYDAMVDLLDTHLHLALGAETRAPLATGAVPYQLYGAASASGVKPSAPFVSPVQKSR